MEAKHKHLIATPAVKAQKLFGPDGNPSGLLVRPAGNRPPASLISLLAVIVWLGGLHLNILLMVVTLATFPSTTSLSLIALLLFLAYVPITSFTESPLGRHLASFILTHAPTFFPLEALIEDPSSFDKSKTYVFGAEPHSVLPLGLISLRAFDMLAVAPTQMRLLATSVVFRAPFVRHVWSSLGLAPATKSNFRRLLRQGVSCILVPGGVQEVIFMEPGKEVVFLKSRKGFVRLAIEAGASLVPVFVFGQTQTYHFWKPKHRLYSWLSRAVGFTPLFFWGMFGSPVPFPNHMRLVIGRPIDVVQSTEPTIEQVDEVHGRFVKELSDLFERHRDAAGCSDQELVVH